MTNLKTGNDIRIDEANEGELFDGNDKRIGSKNTNEEKFSYATNKSKSAARLSESNNNYKLITKSTQKNGDYSTRQAYDKLNDISHESKNHSLTDNGSFILQDNDEEYTSKKISAINDDKTDLLSKMDLKSNLFSVGKEKPSYQDPKPMPNFAAMKATPQANRSPLFSNENSSDYYTKSIDIETAKCLRNLLFGNLNQTFNQEWKNQGLTFCDIAKLKFGIVQKKGGPCGVLASIQAYIVQELLFSEDGLKEPNLMQVFALFLILSYYY